MRADADEHPKFGFKRAMPIGGIRRLLQLVRIRIGQERYHLFTLHRVERLLRAAEDENRPLSPADDDLPAFGDLADVEIYWAAGRQRRSIRIHLIDERHQSRRCPDGAHRRSGDIEKIAPGRLRGVAGRRARCSARHNQSFAIRFVGWSLCRHSHGLVNLAAGGSN